MTDKILLIQDLRISIDNLDKTFMHLLAERMRLIERIFDYKRINKIDYNRSQSRQEDIALLRKALQSEGLSEEFTEFFFHSLFSSAMEKYQDHSHPTIDIKDFGIKLANLRSSRKNIETAMLSSLVERFKVVEMIGHVKAKNNMPALDEGRWSSLLNQKLALSAELGLAPELVESLFTRIHKEALTIEGHPEDAE